MGLVSSRTPAKPSPLSSSSLRDVGTPTLRRVSWVKMLRWSTYDGDYLMIDVIGATPAALFWAAEPISNICGWFKQRLLHIPMDHGATTCRRSSSFFECASVVCFGETVRAGRVPVWHEGPPGALGRTRSAGIGRPRWEKDNGRGCHPGRTTGGGGGTRVTPSRVGSEPGLSMTSAMLLGKRHDSTCARCSSTKTGRLRGSGPDVPGPWLAPPPFPAGFVVTPRLSARRFFSWAEPPSLA